MIPGGNPRLVGGQCYATLTTVRPANMTATQFPLPCGAYPQGEGGSEHQSVQLGGGGQPLIAGSPGVSAVVPFEDTAGSVVLLNGTSLQAATAVMFGIIPATPPFQVVPEPGGDFGLDVTVPGGNTGIVNVQVQVGGVWSTTNCSNEFEYGTPLSAGTPQIENAVPGNATPGTLITIMGDNLHPTDTVDFGIYQATSMRFVDWNQLNAVLPPQAVPNQGSGSVSVTGPHGTSPETCVDFSILGASLLSISPSGGYYGEGITLNGQNFSSNAQVYFGSTAASTHWVNSQQITATVPAGGYTENVTVYQNGFTSNGIPFTYQAGASLTSISPSSQYQTLTVTLYGGNFSSLAVAYFGAGNPASTSYVSPTELQATVPDGSGTVTLTVKESGVTSNGLQFTYLSPYPSVTSVSPAIAPAGTTVTIIGTGFTTHSTVLFGSVSATSVTFISSSQLSAKAPAGHGTVNVAIWQFGVTNAITCDDHFSYAAIPPVGGPTVNCLVPTSGPPGTVVNIYGTNLSSTPFVLFGGVPTPSVTVISSSQIEAVAPLGLGSVPVVVQDGIGSSPLVASDLFTLVYSSPPPTNPARTTTSLPSAVAAAPYSTLQLVATDIHSGNVVLYSAKPGGGWTSTPLAPFNLALGSNILNQVGETSLLVEGGTPGQVAFTRDWDKPPRSLHDRLRR